MSDSCNLHVVTYLTPRLGQPTFVPQLPQKKKKRDDIYICKPIYLGYCWRRLGQHAAVISKKQLVDLNVVLFLLTISIITTWC